MSYLLHLLHFFCFLSLSLSDSPSDRQECSLGSLVDASLYRLRFDLHGDLGILVWHLLAVFLALAPMDHDC